MFKVEDAVSVDTGEYDLVAPGATARLPGVVLAVSEGMPVQYYVRLRRPLGAIIDITVPADKVGSP